MNKVRFVCIGGILTTATVLLQSAPVFLPAVGLALSPFSTLPVAIAAVFHVFLGFAVLIASALLLVMVSIQEAVILLFTTGLLGIVIGALLCRRGIIISILVSSMALCLGMICLTYIIHVPAFASLTDSLSIPLTFLIFYVFSFIYAAIWNGCFKKFMGYLVKTKIR